MALNSINTNIASYSAQGNIGRASDSASASVSRLSSGNRIVRASDDVAALSVGTSLRTTVSTLKVALTNSSQATSLLQVADGGLGQIAEILQRQKAISVQANSGTLSATERSYLNQEFQSLRSQIDQIATSSSFSAVKLLDGSLAGAIGVNSNNATNIDTTVASVTSGNVFALTGVGVNNDVLSINGFEFTLTTATVGTATADGKVRIGATATETAANIARFLNSNSDARLANYTFASAGANVTVSWGGGAMAAAQTVEASTVTGTAATYGAANGTLAVTNARDGISLDRVRALGTVTGSLLASGDSTALLAGSAIGTDNLINNDAFIGKFGEGAMGVLSGTFIGTDTATFTIKVGDITYSSDAAATNLTLAAASTLTFTGQNQYGVAAGGTFTLNLRGGAITAGTITGQADVDDVANQFNAALSGIDFTQNRDVTSFTSGEIVVVGGEQAANLTGASVNFRSADFSSVNIESVKITAPNVGTTDARFEVVIDGETFVSTAGIGSQIGTNDIVAMQSQSDPNKVLSIVFGGTGIASAATTVADLGTQEKANAVAAALEKAFGLDNAGSKLNFQVGVSSTETIGVKIASVKADSLYSGVNLDISTQAGAQQAADVIDAALVNVTKVRADVGALQSRLGFTSANLQTSVQNQDAARGVLLDTDVAAESTSYATSQVQMQAGISVLAQANLFTQNLLKLIG